MTKEYLHHIVEDKQRRMKQRRLDVLLADIDDPWSGVRTLTNVVQNVPADIDTDVLYEMWADAMEESSSNANI